jgi:hypothetical protein
VLTRAFGGEGLFPLEGIASQPLQALQA